MVLYRVLGLQLRPYLELALELPVNIVCIDWMVSLDAGEKKSFQLLLDMIDVLGAAA